MKTGVLGGTFDPIHNGHLAIAEEARLRLDLAGVVFVPAGRPWFKKDSDITPAEHRVEMVRLAIAGHTSFRLSMVEVDRAGPSYTVDTIAGLRSELGADVELYFIMGMDSLPQLPRWREPGRLIRLCRIVAVPRPGSRPPDLAQLETRLPGLLERLILLDKPEVDISATDIRRRVTKGLSIRHLVPAPVEEYIRQHRLYGKR